MKTGIREVFITAILATVVSVQASVTVQVGSSDDYGSATWIVTDLNVTPPSVSGDGSPGAVGFLGAVSEMDGSEEISLNFKAASDYTNSAAAAAIGAGTFAAYVDGLTTAGNLLNGLNANSWGINSSANGTDSSTANISNIEALIIEVSTTNLSSELIFEDLGWKIEPGDLIDVLIYDATSNSVTVALENQNPGNFTGPYNLGDGDIIVIGTRSANNYRWSNLTFDIASTASGVIPPVAFTTTASNSMVQLDWLADASGTLDYYNVYRRTDTNVAYSSTPFATSIMTNSYQDFTAENGTTYYYVATAVDAVAFETDKSLEASATPAIPVPTGLTAEPDDGLVSLNWNDSVDYLFDSYTVYRTTSSGSGYAGIASNLTESAFVDSNVVNDVTYYYAVAQVDVSNRVSELSTEISATPTTALIIEVPDTNLQADTRANDDGSGGYLPTGSRVVPNSDLKAGEYNGEIARPVVKFPLAVADLGARTTGDVKRVVLRMFLNQNQLAEDGNDNSVEVYASQLEDASTDVVASDFEDATYTWAADWTSITTNSPIGDYYDVDVTAAVLADLANDAQDASAGSCFRLQIKDDLTLMTTSNGLVTCRFNDNSNVRPPQLRVEFNSNYSFEQWAALWPVEVGVETNDYDDDGVNNLYEYGLDGNPTNALDRGEQPFIINTGSGLEYIHVKRSDDPTLVYRVETTDNLVVANWTNIGFTAIGTNITEETLNVVTNSIDTTGAQKFIRLIIEN